MDSKAWIRLFYRIWFFSELYFAVVAAHICIIEEQFDPATNKIRYAVPRAERCFCQRLVLRPFRNQTCPIKEDDAKTYFVDNPIQLTNRRNWVKEILDVLLERDECYTGAPQITCPNNLVKDTDFNQSTALVVWEPLHTYTADDTTKVTCNTSQDQFEIGETKVVCTAYDEAGNVASCSFLVKIVDTQDPTIHCPDNKSHESDPGKPTTAVSWDAPTSNDNMNVDPTVHCDRESGSEFKIGKSSVECTALDPSGNKATCSFTVFVEDTENPSLVCPDQTLNTSPGLPTAKFEKPATTDNSGTATLTCTADEVRIGRSEVSCEASDSSGNRAHCSFTVDVSDKEPPIVACPINQVLETSPTEATVVGSWASPKITDNSGQSLTAECDSISGTHLEIGTKTITCRAEDSSGNKGVCSFTIEVIDTIPPTLLDCPIRQNLNTDEGQSYTVVSWALPSATDNAREEPVVSCDPKSGSHFYIQTVTVGCKAKDASENLDECTFKVDVKDVEAPQINCTGNQFFCTDTNKTYAKWRNPTVTDNSDSDNTVSCTKSGQSEVIDTLEQGTTNVTCTASDYSKNLASCIIPVTVEDTKNWGTWGEWGGCSVTCDNGIQTRVRGCSDDSGRAGGHEAETRNCTVATKCPYWSEWDSWNHCSVTCGYGVQVRERQCITTRDRCPDYSKTGYRKDAKELSLEKCQPEKQIELTSPSQSSVFSGVPGNATDGVHTKDAEKQIELTSPSQSSVFSVSGVPGNATDGFHTKDAEKQIELTSPSQSSVFFVSGVPGNATDGVHTKDAEKQIELTSPSQSSVFSVSGVPGNATDGVHTKDDFPKDCKQVYDNGNDTSGVYDIYPQDGGPSLKVYCDMEIDGGGWLVFQRRVDGSEDFNRDWDDYAKGFGNLASEHWFGNDKISRIAAQGTYELRVDLEDFVGATKYAKYRQFQLGNVCTNYTLLVSGYDGDAGDSLSHHNKRRFSTKDQDHDDHPDSCAAIHAGAWWYGYCLHSNLNGQYLKGPSFDRGVFWRYWRGPNYSLKRTEMKIRPITG